MGSRGQCSKCRGVGRILHAPDELHRPNGTKVQSFPYWVDCDRCGGTGHAPT